MATFEYFGVKEDETPCLYLVAVNDKRVNARVGRRQTRSVAVSVALAPSLGFRV